MTGEIQNVELTIEINNKQPVELVDLTKSLLSLANQFNIHAEQTADSIEKIEGKLYVKEIKTGSIIVSLIEVAASTHIPFIENINTIVTFATKFKNIYNYFAKGEGEKPELTTVDYKDLSAILNPVAKDNSSQMNISTTINGGVTIYVQAGSIEANALQNKFKNEIGELKKPEQLEGENTKVLFYWYQAKGDLKSKTGNKGKIDSINNAPLNVIFSTEDIKEQMIKGEENPFNTTYVVDVKIETVNGKPSAYKILKIHEIFKKD